MASTQYTPQIQWPNCGTQLVEHKHNWYTVVSGGYPTRPQAVKNVFDSSNQHVVKYQNRHYVVWITKPRGL